MAEAVILIRGIYRTGQKHVYASENAGGEPKKISMLFYQDHLFCID
jgi:hypothetical protein